MTQTYAVPVLVASGSITTWRDADAVPGSHHHKLQRTHPGIPSISSAAPSLLRVIRVMSPYPPVFPASLRVRGQRSNDYGKQQTRTPAPPKIAGLKRQELHENKMTEAEHTEQLGYPMLGIIFADVVSRRCSMQSRTGGHALCVHILRDSCGADLARHHSSLAASCFQLTGRLY